MQVSMALVNTQHQLATHYHWDHWYVDNIPIMLTSVKINKRKQQIFFLVYQTSNSLPIIQKKKKKGTEVYVAVWRWSALQIHPGHICITQENGLVLWQQELERRVGRGERRNQGNSRLDLSKLYCGATVLKKHIRCRTPCRNMLTWWKPM